MKLFWNWAIGLCIDVVKRFFYFSSDGHFVQPSTTILAYLVEGHPRDISVKLFENWSIGLGADII